MLARLVKNKLFWLVVVTVASLATLSATSKPRDNLMFYEKAFSYLYVPIQKGFAYTTGNVQEMFSYFNDSKVLTDENEQLKLRVAQLEDEVRKLSGLQEENERLREVLRVKGKFDNYEMVTCRIISKEAGNWFNIFTIDKGTNDGIDYNMAVITPKGLVGKVVYSTPESSKVVAIIDNGSYASARLSKTRDLVGIRGDLTLNDQGLIRMVYIPVGVQVSEGDIVETSGMGGIFPSGIMIGTVVKVDNDKPQLMRSALVQPAADFKRLEEVVVLKRK